MPTCSYSFDVLLPLSLDAPFVCALYQPMTSLDLRLLLNCLSNLCRWTLYLFRIAMAYCSHVE
jgi:hypothetical protein